MGHRDRAGAEDQGVRFRPTSHGRKQIGRVTSSPGGIHCHEYLIEDG